MAGASTADREAEGSSPSWCREMKCVTRGKSEWEAEIGRKLSFLLNRIVWSYWYGNRGAEEGDDCDECGELHISTEELFGLNGGTGVQMFLAED